MKIQVFCLLLITIKASALGQGPSVSMVANGNAMSLQDMLANASDDSQGLNAMGNGEDYAEGDMQGSGYMTSEGSMQGGAAMNAGMSGEGAAWESSLGGSSMTVQQGFGGVTSQGTVVSVSKPVYAQRLISQPIIKRQIIQQPVIRRRILKKNLIQSVQNMAPVVNNRNVNRTVNVSVPAKEINNLTVVRPRVHTNNVEVKFNKGPQRTVTRATIVEPVRTRAEARSRTVQAPGTVNVHHTVNQPTVHTVRENVNFSKQADRTVNHRPVTRATRYTRRQRTQAVNAAGNEVHNYTTIKPMVRTERVNVQFVRQPQQVTNNPERVENVQRRTVRRVQNAQVPANKTIIQPIVQNIVRDREMHHIHKPIFKRVEVVRTVKVPTNIIQKVAVVKRVKVPVRTQGKVQVFKGKEYWDTRYQGRAMGPGSSGNASASFNMSVNANAAAADAQEASYDAGVAQEAASAAYNAASSAEDAAEDAAEGAAEWAAEAGNAGDAQGEWAAGAGNAGDAQADNASSQLGEWSEWTADNSGASAGDASANGEWANAAWDSAAESNEAADNQGDAQGWSFGTNMDSAPLNLSNLGLSQAGFQQLNLGQGAVMIGDDY